MEKIEAAPSTQTPPANPSKKALKKAAAAVAKALTPQAAFPMPIAKKDILSEHHILEWRRDFRTRRNFDMLIKVIDFFYPAHILARLGKQPINMHITKETLSNLCFTLAVAKAFVKEGQPMPSKIIDFIHNFSKMNGQLPIFPISCLYGELEVEQNDEAVDQLIFVVRFGKISPDTHLVFPTEARTLAFRSLALLAHRFPDVRERILHHMEHCTFNYLDALTLEYTPENLIAVKTLICSVQWTNESDHPLAQKLKIEALTLLQNTAATPMWLEIFTGVFERIREDEEISPLILEIFAHSIIHTHWLAQTTFGKKLLETYQKDPLAFLTELKKIHKKENGSAFGTHTFDLSSPPDQLFYDLFLVWSFMAVSDDHDESIYRINCTIKITQHFIKLSAQEDQKAFIFSLLEVLFFMEDPYDKRLEKIRKKISTILEENLATSAPLLEYTIKKLYGDPFNNQKEKWAPLIEKLWALRKKIPPAKVEHPKAS